MSPRKKRRSGPPSRSVSQEAAQKPVRRSSAEITKMTTRDVQRLVKELQNHQIELEAQNKQLRKIQILLADSRDRYSDLYEFAPVGYVTVDKNGKILESNLMAARMFGVESRNLLHADVAKFLHPSSQDAWYSHRRAAFASRGKEVCEIEMRKADGAPLAVRLEGIALGAGDDRRCRVALTDITQTKQAEDALRELTKTLERRVQDLQTVSSELLLAEERERQRLAHDLHDGLGQALFRARTKLDQLPAADPAVAEIGAILEEMGKMVNTLTFELSPPVLRLIGLRPAIRGLARDMKNRYALSVQVDDDGEDCPLDERVALILFRSLRELLRNVAKHAQTDQARLSLRRSDQNLQVEVEDRGKGFDPGDQSRQVESGRFGLFSIRERLEYLHGTFTIWSVQGAGTRVTLSVPLATGKAVGRGSF